MSDMTRADRTELRSVVRLRCKVARNGIKARTAELLAEFESQVAAQYRIDDARWKDVTTAAAQAVAEADALVAAACEEAGIPADFRPQLNLSWYDRGKSAGAQRREELRKVAHAQLDAVGKAASAAIDRAELDAYTDLAAGALQSDEARAWLEKLPTLEQLMPPLQIADAKAALSLGEGKLTSKERRALTRWGAPVKDDDD